ACASDPSARVEPAADVRPGADARRSPFAGLVDRIPLDDQRRYLIVGGLDMFRDHPLTGVGYGGFQRSLVGTYAYDIKPGNRDTLSHNSFVTVLAEQGLVGFLTLLAILVAVAREVRRRLRGSRA